MEILDKKSTEIVSLFEELDELLNIIQQALKNRTPNLNGEKFLSNWLFWFVLCHRFRSGLCQ